MLPPLRTASTQTFGALSRASACLLLASALIATGCARGRGGHRHGTRDLGANTPPVMGLGGLIRTQDGNSLVRRLRKRDAANAGPAVASAPPRVRWTDPPVAAPRPAAEPAKVAALPPPPALPSEEPRAALAGSPAPAPPPARNVSEVRPVSEPPAQDSPPATTAPADSIQALRALIDRSRARLDAIRSYQVAMNRQEQVNGTLQPAEDVLLSIRREPRAVRLEWPTGKSKGREVIYATKETNGQMAVYSPGSLVPRVSLAPDSPLVLRSSRHPITEAGFDSVLDNLENSLRPHEAGQAGGATLALAGTETPPEVGRPCRKIVETRTNGERWVVYLDAETDLPAMVRGVDASGAVLESYRFGVPTIDPPALAEAGAFDPDARWGGGRGGLLGRMAGGAPTATGGPR